MLDPWQPTLHPEWAIAIAVFAIDYAVVARHLRQRGVAVDRVRCLAFAAGLLILAVALLSPIEHLALTSMLSFHLLQNVMIADWAPPLLVWGLLPAMALSIDRRPAVRRLTQPWIAIALWLAAWYVIHLPAVYDYALAHRWALGIEHLVFIVTGILFWWAEIVPGRMTAERRIVYLFVALVVMMPLDVFIGLYPEPLYAFYEHTPKLGGISALTDQRIAGATAVLAETLVFAIALLLAALELRSRGRRRS